MTSPTRRTTCAAALAAATALLLVACGGGESAPEASAAGAPPRAQAQALTPQEAGRFRWSAPINLSLVPVAGSVLPNGKVLFWSSGDRFNWGTVFGRTYTSLFDPATHTATERLVSETGHDMFCPGTTNLADGRLLVNGGDDATKTSLYDPASNTWSNGGDMTIPRGYQGNTLLQDGSVFTLGGSFNGGGQVSAGNKHGEVRPPITTTWPFGSTTLLW